jgi:hypothetical protein
MRFTNKFGLPDTILRAAQVNDALYSKGEVDRSVTQLIAPPRIDALRKAHFQEFEKDLSEEWWALFGSAVHHILEMGAAPNQMVEERLFMEIDGWKISGMADLQEYHKDDAVSVSVTISDYKVTTAYALTQEGGVKPEWVQQLNLLAYLVHHNKIVRVKELQVVAIVRDWQRSQAAIDPLYPIAPVVRLKVPLWSLKKQEAYLYERVGLHRETQMLMELGEELPECTDEERWMHGHTWAIMKAGGKKATKVYDNEAEALADLKDRKPGYNAEFRPGKSVRCEGNYCGVAEWCSQWKKLREQTETA